MNPLVAIDEWLSAMPEYADYKAYQGLWRDDPTNAGNKLISLVASGGRAGATQDVDYDLVDIHLFTKQKGLAERNAVADFAYAIRDRLKTDWSICDIVQFQIIGGIVGPGMTTEDRYWYRLTMQVTQ